MGVHHGSYTYNGDGQRMSKTVFGHQAFVWDLPEGIPTLLKDGASVSVTADSGLALPGRERPRPRES
jgi:hypothetical protein